MTRRAALSRLALTAGLAATAALTSCSATGTGGDAAKVGDHVISNADFQGLLDDLTKLSVTAGVLATDTAGAPLAPPVLTGDFARGRLAAWVTAEAMSDDLAARGRFVTDAQRAAVQQELETSFANDWTIASPRVREHLVDTNAAIEAFIASYTDAAAVQASYEQGIAASGYACVSHILLATEDEAKAVLAELAGGADFATVAAQRSTDTGSGQAGGALTDQSSGSPCMAADAFKGAFVPEFVQGALDATVGVPTQPIKSDFGYHIILVRPFAEVSAIVLRLAGATAAQAHYADVFAGAHVTVANRYGRWDPDRLDVVALA